MPVGTAKFGQADLVKTETHTEAPMRRHAAEALRDLSSKYPEVDGNIVHFKFKGRGQRDTPVTHTALQIPKSRIKTTFGFEPAGRSRRS